MKPTKVDFPAFVTFSQNISDAEINPHINDVYKFEIKPRLATLAVDILSTPHDNSRPQLQAFYDDFILHWWILLAMKRFLQKHGFNVTQFGYTKMNDPQGTFTQMSPQERVIQGKQYDSDAEVLYYNALAETWTFDGTTYRKPNADTCTPRNTGSFGISAIE